MQCPSCRVESVVADARFCAACGARLVGPATSGARRHEPALPASFAAGRYRVERLLGEGGSKRVYLAHDTHLERDVAVGLVKTDGLDEPGLARIRREARAMGRLGDHPNVVTIFDVGEENGQPFIVSQYMAGGSLDDLLARSDRRRLSVEHAVRLATEVTRALEHAEACGIVHRDLKPSNIWLAADGTAKIGDFGLALALDRSRLTREGRMVGTVAYMPPEQALGRAADARNDIYSLGAVLYELVTGRPPFVGDDPVAVISQHINTSPVAPSWHNPEVPRTLDALILRLLAKVPEERPASARLVGEALAAIAEAARAPAPRPPAAEPNPLDRLAGGAFVGRERELDELRAALDATLAGTGRLVLLVGEPGIGKTRLAEELMTYARLRKAQVLWGRCYEGEGAPAYWPWVQAIRIYVHDRDPQALLAELGSGAADIAQVVSELRARLPGLPPPPQMEPGQARFRLFDGVTTFLKNAAKAQPLVLVLDDLHWADKPSLLLLQFLARELRAAPLLVLGTYRDVELRRAHPLAQTLGELAREQLAHRVLLRGLSERDVGRLIEIAAGVKPAEALVEAAHRQTEGNPFFVNEVVRLLVADGRLEHPDQASWTVGIPEGVREVIGRRLDHLSGDCNRLLTIASVIGREFALEVLQGVTGLAEDRLLELLDDAVAARVLVELSEPVGRYAFAHALVRETLYEELTTMRRVRLHRQVGEALETVYGAHPDPHLAELAYHFFEAAQGGDVDKAIGYAVRAGDRAAAMMAHEEAVRHFEMALQAFEMRQPRAEAHRCELLLRLVEMLWRTGEYDRARETALGAAEVARRSGTADQLARAALAYAGRLLAFGAVVRDETLVGLLEEALQALPGSDSPLRARLLARLAEEIVFTEDYERRESICREAVAMAERLGDPAVHAAALRSMYWSLWVPQNLAERPALAREIITLAEQGGDRLMAVEAHMLQLWAEVEMGDIAAARRDLERNAHLAEEVRLPYFRWGVAMGRVLLALAQGRLAESEALAQQALQIGQETQNRNAALVFGLQMALILRERGQNEELVGAITGLAGLYPPIAVNLRCALALAYCDLGRTADARRELEDLAAHGFADLPHNVAWFFSLAYLVEVCASLGDALRAAALYALLQPFAQHNVAVAGVVAFGSASRYLALAAATMGRADAAISHFEDALAMNRRMDTRQALVRTEVEYAQILLARDDPDDRPKSLALLNAALEAATEIGMKLAIERALTLKLQAQGVKPLAVGTSIDAVVSVLKRERPDLRPHTAPDGTVTILSTDIDGSNGLAERLGDRRWHEVLRAHNAIVRREIQRQGGVEVKTQRDAILAAFQSARRALACAICTQRALHAYAAQHPEAPIRARVGLHTGEAISETAGFSGETVIATAASIMSRATGGEILTSSLLRELTTGAGFTFDAGRELNLDGASPKRAFAVAW